MRTVYFDYNATTPVDRRVLAVMLPYFSGAFGNAASTAHSYGWEALQAVRVGLKEGMAAGLAYERAAVARLSTSSACRNLVHLFLQNEAARKPWDDYVHANRW